MNHTITTQPIHISFKFLECWFTATLKYNKQIKLIKQEVSRLNNILKTKNITDKQATYIINNVIIPIIEYCIHNIVIPKTTCNSINRKSTRQLQSHVNLVCRLLLEKK